MSVFFVTAHKANYEGYKVFRIYPIRDDQLEVIAKLQKNGDINFWTHLNRFGKPVDVMVKPKTQPLFMEVLDKNEIRFQTLIDNVKFSIEQGIVVQKEKFMTREGDITFNKFLSVLEINCYLSRLSTEYSDIVRVEDIGKTYIGLTMKVIQISTNHTANKPIIFIDAGIHGREWIAPAQALYIINQLVENPNNRCLLENIDWHISPLVNPDGYEYSLIFKTLSFTKNSTCFGVDLNRNFDFHWGESGATNNPCSEEYMGSAPFSEIEARNLQYYILNYKDRIKLYLTLHSYGSFLLYPWGYSSDLPENAKELHLLAESVRNAISEAGGPVYTVGSVTNVLYSAAGGSDDWAKGVAASI
ncbi:hypothetical protein FQA39_LY18969 [Lamprigera yunnana]|nr:hypothetical protein FQA39_LY18969 [Lamprigera yunnana]